MMGLPVAEIARKPSGLACCLAPPLEFGMRFCIVVVFLLSLAASTANAAGFQIEHYLSSKEIHALDQGEIVVVNNRSGLLGGTGFVTVAAPQPKVWGAITQYAEHPTYMPAILVSNPTQPIRLAGGLQNKLDLYTVYAMPWPFPNVYIFCNVLHDTSHAGDYQMDWRAFETNLKTAYGRWHVLDRPTTTLVVYEMNFDIDYVPRLVANGLSRQGLRFALGAIRDHVLQSTHPLPAIPTETPKTGAKARFTMTRSAASRE